MGLLQNVRLIAQHPIRPVGGATASVLARTQLGINGLSKLSPHASAAGWEATASFPTGWNFGNGWMPAQSANGAWRANLGNTAVTFTASLGTLNLAAGRNLDNLTFPCVATFSLPNAQLQLIVSAAGEVTATFTTDGNLAGSLAAAGDVAATFTVGMPTIGAIADLLAPTVASFSTAATIRATGALAGDITPFTELSPESLSAAVWAASAGTNNVAGSMGEKLNDAGSAANPWTEVIESGYTAAEILRVLAAVAAGKKTVDGGTVMFRDLGDTKDRVVGTVSGSNRTGVTLEVDV